MLFICRNRYWIPIAYSSLTNWMIKTKFLYGDFFICKGYFIFSITEVNVFSCYNRSYIDQTEFCNRKFRSRYFRERLILRNLLYCNNIKNISNWDPLKSFSTIHGKLNKHQWILEHFTLPEIPFIVDWSKHTQTKQTLIQ